MRHHIAAVIAAALVAGCGSEKSETERTLSCDNPSVGICLTITARMADSDVGDLQAQCIGLGGVNLDGACPTADTVPGHCHMDLGAGDTKDAYYASSKWTPQSAQEECAMPPAGIWVP